jgi:hypothetical protein
MDDYEELTNSFYKNWLQFFSGGDSPDLRARVVWHWKES